MVCTFFGHRDTPFGVRGKLEETLTELIEKHDARVFYVGAQGNFDMLVSDVLKLLAKKYPEIQYTVVLSSMPRRKNGSYHENDSNTLYLAELAKVPPKFAILRRNKWLVDHSDTVITYVENSWGGAAIFKEYAEKQGKTVINLA